LDSTPRDIFRLEKWRKLCESFPWVYIGSRPHFTATPESEDPVFLTCAIDMRLLLPPQGIFFAPQALDITVRVRTWRHDGRPTQNVAFNWIAIAEVAVVIHTQRDCG
jgi:hypothetical protein